MNLRSVTRLVEGQNTSDGAGVRLKRSIGTGALDHLDPFLLLDEFKSDQAGDYIAGFPDHPHRGFETVTYMLAGRMEHRDHVGNQGNLVAGSVQWMTAGRGIVHSEMPQQEDGLMWGFQLWVNLPAEAKMTAPRYQDIPPEDVPEVVRDGVRIRIIAGEVDQTKGPIHGIVTNPTYLDVGMDPGASFTHPIPEGHNGFVYTYDGAGMAGITEDSEGTPSEGTPSEGTPVKAGTLAVLGDGDALKVAASSDSGFRFLIIAAKPIGEPIARYGPFVMNTQQEIEQALADYRSGAFIRVTSQVVVYKAGTR